MMKLKLLFTGLSCEYSLNILHAKTKFKKSVYIKFRSCIFVYFSIVVSNFSYRDE